MTETLQGISDLIVDKLESLNTGGMDPSPLIPEVRDYANGLMEAFPLAEVLPTGGATTARIDTGRNERTFEFQIKLYQEQSEAGKGSQASTDALKTVCQAILAAFDTDKDFDMEIENLMVTRMDFDYSPSAGPKVFATFIVECVIIIPNV